MAKSLAPGVGHEAGAVVQTFWLGTVRAGVFQIPRTPRTTPGKPATGSAEQLTQVTISLITNVMSAPVSLTMVSGTWSVLSPPQPFWVAPVFAQAPPKSMTGGGGTFPEAAKAMAGAPIATTGTAQAAPLAMVRRLGRWTRFPCTSDMAQPIGSPSSSPAET